MQQGHQGRAVARAGRDGPLGLDEYIAAFSSGGVIAKLFAASWQSTITVCPSRPMAASLCFSSLLLLAAFQEVNPGNFRCTSTPPSQPKNLVPPDGSKARGAHTPIPSPYSACA